MNSNPTPYALAMERAHANSPKTDDNDRREMYIPFAGFYESVHDDQINHEVEMMAESEDVDFEIVHDAINYSMVRLNYAKAYAENVDAWIAHESRDPDGTNAVKLGFAFADLVSPREYNFSTDRIRVSLSMESVRQLWENVSPATMADVCNERHRSRSGFYSFYSPNFYTWGQIGEWDANQLESLFIAFLRDRMELENESELDDKIIEFDHEMAGQAFVHGAVDEAAIRAAKGEDEDGE